MTITDALLAARGRGVLPTALASRDAREAFAREVRRRAVFSARTTSMVYLSIMRDAVEALLQTEQHGVSIGQAETRLRLKQALETLHYDPENGHFGTRSDAPIPPAKPGSMQDLSSDRRLNLIIDTQRMLWQSAAQNTRAKEPVSLHLFPAWELRPGYARAPRRDWQARWIRVGGTLYEGRLIAPVGDPVWERLGNGRTFKDALDTETPPFAFGSTRRWRGVSRQECIGLGVPLTTNPGLKAALNPQPPSPPAPAPDNLPPPPPEGASLPKIGRWQAPSHDLPVPKATVPPDMNPAVERNVTTTLKISVPAGGSDMTYEKAWAAEKERVRLARLARQQQQNS